MVLGSLYTTTVLSSKQAAQLVPLSLSAIIHRIYLYAGHARRRLECKRHTSLTAVCVTLLNIRTHSFEFWQVLVNAQIRTLSFLQMWISIWHFFFRLSYLTKKRNKIQIKIPRLFFKLIRERDSFHVQTVIVVYWKERKEKGVLVVVLGNHLLLAPDVFTERSNMSSSSSSQTW